MNKILLLVVISIFTSVLTFSQTVHELYLGEEQVEFTYDSTMTIISMHEATVIFTLEQEFILAVTSDYVTFYVDLGERNSLSRQRIRYYFETGKFECVDFSLNKGVVIKSRSGHAFQQTDIGLIIIQ